MNVAALILRAVAAASCASACMAVAADALVPVQVPADFRIKPTGRQEAVLYTESVGERRNPLDRATVEAQCQAARAGGLTDKHPVFESGHDQPLKTESRRFSAGRRWAEMSTAQVYQCDGPPDTTGSVGYLCGCTYRLQERRSVQIGRIDKGRHETLQVDLARGTARRRSQAPAAAPDPGGDAARVKALAPEIVGKDQVAGVACVVRRQKLGANAWTDRCIVEDEAMKLHPDLRFRALSESTPARDGKGMYSWMKAVKVIQNASVDAGVFELPAGVVLQETPR